MRQVSGESGDVLAAVASSFPEMVMLFPVVLAASVVLRICLLRQKSSFRLALVDAVLAHSVLLVVRVVSLPQAGGADSRIRPVPGTDLGVAIHASPGDVLPWLQLIGNLMLLCPIGALLPMRSSWFGRLHRIAALAFVLTCAIELSQLAFLVGRVASADDILLNTSGAVLGAMLSRSWWSGFVEPQHPLPSLRIRTAVGPIKSAPARFRPVEVS